MVFQLVKSFSFESCFNPVENIEGMVLFRSKDSMKTVLFTLRGEHLPPRPKSGSKIKEAVG